jgi:N-acetyl-gamma-glutamyl-phosphate reductase
MGRPVIFIDGEAGTTGLQIRSRLAARSDIELVSIDPAKRKDDAERRRMLNGVDMAVLCLPDDAARTAVGLIDNPAVRVLDASTAYRTDPDWTYGFAELCAGQAERIAKAKRVTNPGCYATAAVAILRPLVERGVLAATAPVTIHGVSGYSGGGRQLIDAFEGRGPAPITEPYRAYALGLTHKHVPEMRVHAGLARNPLFTPGVGAFRQGMLVQVPLPLWSLPRRVTARDLHQALAEHYDGQRFVRVMPFDGRPQTLAPDALNGTNLLELFIFDNPADETALVMSRLDNLGKGASGAAVQNLDLMLDLPGERDYRIG